MEALRSELLEKYISQRKPSLANSVVQKEGPVIKNTEPDKFETKEKTKKGKIAKIALLSSVVLTTAAAVLASIRYKNKIRPVAESIRNFFVSTGENANKTLESAKVQTKKLGKYQKGLNNLTNVKDAYARKFLSKIPFYDRYDKKTSDIYRKFLTDSIQKKYNKVQNAVIEADKTLLDAVKRSDITPKEKTTLEEIITKRNKRILEYTKKENVLSRIKELDNSMNGIDKSGIQNIEEKIKKGWRHLKIFGVESVSEKQLKAASKAHHKLMENQLKESLTSDEIKAVKNFIETKADKSTIAKIKKADALLEKAYQKETGDMFGKLRDINFGCAPTDILGILGTTGLLGLYTAQAGTKEEKVKVTLTTGIPLLASFGTTLFATTKMINGVKSLALGTLTGLIANTIGNAINKKYQKAHNTEETVNTIVTLDDYANKVKTAGKNLLK